MVNPDKESKSDGLEILSIRAPYTRGSSMRLIGRMEGDVTGQPSQEGTGRGRGKNKRYWSPQEDHVLIKSLHELASNTRWKSENGFRNGYKVKLEEVINSLLPHCGLRAEPHIASRLKHWSDKFSALSNMLATFGFGWDDEKKMLLAKRSVYDEWIKTHKKQRGYMVCHSPILTYLLKVMGRTEQQENMLKLLMMLSTT